MIANMTGKSLPALTAPASASDIRSGKQAIGADGKVIKGTAFISAKETTTLTNKSPKILSISCVNYSSPKSTVYIGELIMASGETVNVKVSGLTLLGNVGGTSSVYRQYIYLVSGKNPTIESY